MEEKKVKKVMKTFFVWSEKKEARWLEEMSRIGWHLIKPSPFFYTFEKGDPEDFVYQFDFRFGSSKDEEEYLDIFREAGWRLIHRTGAWYYFRKPFQEGGQNRIYSDNKSLKKKYKTILYFLLLVVVPLIYNFFSIFRSDGQSGFYRYFWPLNTFILLLWLYAFIRIVLYLRKVSGNKNIEKG